MLKNSLHTKWVARFFILIYLLLIASTANAFFWCKDVGADSHLESNYSGTCCFPCSPEQQEPHRNEQTSKTNSVFSLDMEDCIDSTVSSSVITPSTPKSPKNKTTLTDISTLNSSFLSAKFLRSGPKTPPLTHQLPPRQTLTALRTISLLC